MSPRWIAGLLAFCLLWSAAAPTRAATETAEQSCYALPGQPVCIHQDTYSADVCKAISAYARHWSLPEGFFARLIWQESRFDPLAISPAGAQGIAQFMPGTAALRALQNPFDPAQALARSAQYLRELEQKYGNLGLAAAAYNAGEGRISKFVAAKGGAPLETRRFVSIITGRAIEYWQGDAAEPVDYALHPDRDFTEACVQMASAVPMPDLGFTQGDWQPWGVLIAQNFSRDLAYQSFLRAQTQFKSVLGPEELLLITVRNPNFGRAWRYSAMIGRATRQDAETLCESLIAAGGSCIVQKNQS